MKHHSSSLNGGHCTFSQGPPASLLYLSTHTHGGGLRCARLGCHRHGTVSSYLSHAESQRPLCTIQGRPYNTGREPERLDWTFAISHLVQDLVRFNLCDEFFLYLAGKMTKETHFAFKTQHKILVLLFAASQSNEIKIDFRTQNTDCVGYFVELDWWLIFHG